jgi:hypothetical protein
LTKPSTQTNPRIPFTVVTTASGRQREFSRTRRTMRRASYTTEHLNAWDITRRAVFARTTKTMPRALARCIGNLRKLAILVTTLLIGLLVVDFLDAVRLYFSPVSASIIHAWIVPLSVAPAALACALIAFEIHRRTRRLWRLAREAHYQLCTSCGQSLQGLPSKHVCPECGAPYDLAEVQSEWEQWFGPSQRASGKAGRRLKDENEG